MSRKVRNVWVLIATFTLAGLMLAACAGEPQTVEVTRVVSQEIPVTVEVTRVVTEVSTVEVPVEVEIEVPVEVTRIVEVMVTPTPEIAETAAAAVEPTPTVAAAGALYTVQSGDNLSLISAKTGTAVADIQSANNITNATILTVGQQLTIPGWDGVELVVAIPTTAPAAAAAVAPPPPAESVVTGPNLLPNPSFEGNWYFYLYNELQVPDGWLLATDEGPNTLEPGAGGNFFRPEVRVVPSQDLPPAEHSLFIFDGNKTLKAFKGGAPTSFSLFTDVALPPGNYRLTVSFFPDTVAGYDTGQKVFASVPLAAEARVIYNNGGTGWQNVQPGQRNTITYDFAVTEGQTVRVGASFRNRFVMVNNGWFIDNWSLYALTTP